MEVKLSICSLRKTGIKYLYIFLFHTLDSNISSIFFLSHT
jgi:hypothetical protein